MLSELVQLNGDRNILQEARQVFSAATPEIHTALDDLEALSLSPQFREVSLHFDLAEARGYHYHTGIVFAIYVSKHGQAIAKGGRYDVGYNRPATGFSTNLLTLLSLLENPPSGKAPAIFAPAQNDATLTAKVQELRQAGEIVISGLANQTGDAQAMGCDRELRLMANGWEVVSFEK